MSEHKIRLSWHRTGGEFSPGGHNRNHVVRFEGGQRTMFSAAPSFGGDPAWVDPEEALVAALSSCHMLTFLGAAAREGLIVDDYRDEATGTLGRSDGGGLAVTRVNLRPRVTFAPTHAPSRERLQALHDWAHRHCIVANSLRVQIAIEDVSQLPVAA